MSPGLHVRVCDRVTDWHSSPLPNSSQNGVRLPMTPKGIQLVTEMDECIKSPVVAWGTSLNSSDFLCFTSLSSECKRLVLGFHSSDQPWFSSFQSFLFYLGTIRLHQTVTFWKKIKNKNKRSVAINETWLTFWYSPLIKILVWPSFMIQCKGVSSGLLIIIINITYFLYISSIMKKMLQEHVKNPTNNFHWSWSLNTIAPAYAHFQG